MSSYKASQAIFDTQELIDTALVQAGLIDGLTLDPDQIKSEKSTMFWFIRVPSEDASKKETYVTYTISNAPRQQSGDGLVLGRKISVPVNIYSRNKYVRSLIESINQSLVDNNWTFELSFLDYDPNIEMYTYGFIAEALVSDE